VTNMYPHEARLRSLTYWYVLCYTNFNLCYVAVLKVACCCTDSTVHADCSTCSSACYTSGKLSLNAASLFMCDGAYLCVMLTVQNMYCMCVCCAMCYIHSAPLYCDISCKEYETDVNDEPTEIKVASIYM
jgi:hypothetical protein